MRSFGEWFGGTTNGGGACEISLHVEFLDEVTLNPCTNLRKTEDHRPPGCEDIQAKPGTGRGTGRLILCRVMQIEDHGAQANGRSV